MGRQRFTEPFKLLVIAAGTVACVFSAARLPAARIDVSFLALALITVVIASWNIVKIPFASGHLTISDTFIFLAMWLYGGEAAVLLAAAESFCSSLRVVRSWTTIFFNAAAMACSTFLTFWALWVFFGPFAELPHGKRYAAFVGAVCVMALVQYAVNSMLVAVAEAFKRDAPIWDTWRTHFVWASIPYLASACAAALIARIAGAYGFYAIILTIPIAAVIYITYQTYRRNIEASAAQAEQARRHIEELSLYIAERKQAEAERDQLLVREQEARAEAEAANRLKDEFLATVSHELRTPLTPILGWARLLRAGGLPAETARQAFEIIERNARAQSRIVDDLLDVSRIVSGKLRIEKKIIDLAPIVEMALEAIRPMAEAKHVRIESSLDEAAGPVNGDPDRLQQVVWNLLSNAVKFTPEGGCVAVRLERAGSSAKLTVRDTGIGIPAEFMPYIFDRFRQANSTSTRSHGGLGLGLAIARHLVERHGGRITAESPGENSGAIFTVELPLFAPQTETAAESAAPAVQGTSAASPVESRPPSLDGLRILVVEDEADTRQFLQHVLERYDAAVRTAASVPDGLLEFEKFRPDVIISDIGMPEEDGYDLLRKVRAFGAERGGQTPAIALTAFARDEDRRRALAAGFQMHVAKPVNPDDLVAAVAGAARRESAPAP
jgi:signal transduction histidine kinase/CheY-like chemotaxis protein